MLLKKYHRIPFRAAFILIVLIAFHWIFSTYRDASIRANRSISVTECFAETLTIEQKEQCIHSFNKEGLLTLENKAKRISNRLTSAFRIDQTYIPLVIVVHDRLHYLKELVKTLEKVHGINETVLIFSHDVYDYEMDLYIRNHVNFTLTWQIYSVTMPTLSKDFLTHHPEYKAGGARHHYHFIWNFLYKQGLPYLFPNSTRDDLLIATMEEDHVVTSDFYYALLFSIGQRKRQCDSSCAASNPGFKTALGIDNGDLYSYTVSRAQNAGISIPRKYMLSVLDTNRDHWCLKNDYNWDWSIDWATKCGILPSMSIVLSTARINHIGGKLLFYVVDHSGCGMHTKEADCTAAIARVLDNYINQMNSLVSHEKWIELSQKSSQQTAETPFIVRRIEAPHDLNQGNGGWTSGVVEINQTRIDWQSRFHVDLCHKIASFYEK